jgi:hypothetical protein
MIYRQIYVKLLFRKRNSQQLLQCFWILLKNGFYDVLLMTLQGFYKKIIL